MMGEGGVEVHLTTGGEEAVVHSMMVREVVEVRLKLSAVDA